MPAGFMEDDTGSVMFEFVLTAPVYLLILFAVFFFRHHIDFAQDALIRVHAGTFHKAMPNAVRAYSDPKHKVITKSSASLQLGSEDGKLSDLLRFGIGLDDLQHVADAVESIGGVAGSFGVGAGGIQDAMNNGASAISQFSSALPAEAKFAPRVAVWGAGVAGIGGDLIGLAQGGGNAEQMLESGLGIVLAGERYFDILNQTGESGTVGAPYTRLGLTTKNYPVPLQLNEPFHHALTESSGAEDEYRANNYFSDLPGGNDFGEKVGGFGMYFGSKFGGADYNPPEGFSEGYAERQPIVVDPWQRRTVWPGNKPEAIVLANELEPAGNEIMFWVLQLMNIFTRGQSQTYGAEDFPNLFTLLWDLIQGIGSSNNIGDFIGGAFASDDSAVPHHLTFMVSKMPRIQKVDLKGDGDILSAAIDTRHKLQELTEPQEDTIKEIVR